MIRCLLVFKRCSQRHKFSQLFRLRAVSQRVVSLYASPMLCRLLLLSIGFLTRTQASAPTTPAPYRFADQADPSRGWPTYDRYADDPTLADMPPGWQDEVIRLREEMTNTRPSGQCPHGKCMSHREWVKQTFPVTHPFWLWVEDKTGLDQGYLGTIQLVSAFLFILLTARGVDLLIGYLLSASGNEEWAEGWRQW